MQKKKKTQDFDPLYKAVNGNEYLSYICCGNCQTLLKTLHAHPPSPKSCVFATEMCALLLCPLKTKFSHPCDGPVCINLFIFIQLAFISVRHMNHHELVSPKQICYQPVISLFFFLYILFFKFLSLHSCAWSPCRLPPPPFPLKSCHRWQQQVFQGCLSASSTNVILSCCHVAFTESSRGRSFQVSIGVPLSPERPYVREMQKSTKSLTGRDREGANGGMRKGWRAKDVIRKQKRLWGRWERESGVLTGQERRLVCLGEVDSRTALTRLSLLQYCCGVSWLSELIRSHQLNITRSTDDLTLLYLFIYYQIYAYNIILPAPKILLGFIDFKVLWQLNTQHLKNKRNWYYPGG